MSAGELVAQGYRLYWVTVSKTVPVLCKPSEVYSLHRAEAWSADDLSEADTDEVPMWTATDKDRGCIPHTTARVDGDPPTIGELLVAQKEAT